MQDDVNTPLKYCQGSFLSEVRLLNAEYERLVGARLREIRESKAMTQEQVAARLQLAGCDVTRSALAKIEVGQRHIYLDEIKAFKEILGVEYDRLFDI